MKSETFVAVGCAVLTISDTRTLETDTSGLLAVERLQSMGHRVEVREILVDDAAQIRARVAELAAGDRVDVIVLTGGTGLTRRDVTPDAIAGIADKHIPGFGELFRWLSFQDIGTSTVQSRADAWLVTGTLVFALPGSTGAVRTGFDGILAEQLDSRHRPCNFIALLPRIRGDK